MATKPQESAQYGDISSNPGRRDKIQNFDTSVGNQATVLGSNPTVNTARAAVAAVVLAARAVASRRLGLARTVESGGQVLAVQIVSGGTGYGTTTNTAATGGNGTGLTLNLTDTAGVITAVAIGNSAGRGYAVGDLLSENSVAGTGLSVRVTSVS